MDAEPRTVIVTGTTALGITVSTTTTLRDDAPSKPFFCERCGKWWQTVRSGVSCLVMHHGTCCHYNDIAATKPEGVTPLTDIEWERFG